MSIDDVLAIIVFIALAASPIILFQTIPRIYRNAFNKPPKKEEEKDIFEVEVTKSGVIALFQAIKESLSGFTYLLFLLLIWAPFISHIFFMIDLWNKNESWLNILNIIAIFLFPVAWLSGVYQFIVNVF